MRSEKMPKNGIEQKETCVAKKASAKNDTYLNN